MLTQGEKNQIVEMTKTASWGFLKKFFEEKELKMYDYMQTLDVDNDKQRKEYKQRKLGLEATKVIINEIEELAKEVATQEEIDKAYEEQEELLNPK